MLLSQDNFNRTEVFIMKAISRTVVPIKPGKKSDAEAFMSQKSREISSVEGLINWGFMYTDENEITVIAVYTNKDSAQNATKYVNELLGEVAPLVSAPPIRNIYDAQWY